MSEQTQQTETLPAELELDRFARLGTWLAAVEGSSDPKGTDGMAAALRFAYAAALGWPIQTASELSVIRGNIFISTKLKRALAAQAGYRVERTDESDEHVTASVIAIETGQEVGRATFTMAEAARAGLVKSGSAWETYPKRMLWARAASFALDDCVPEVTLGFKTMEEAADLGWIEAEAVEVEDEPSEESTEDEPAQAAS